MTGMITQLTSLWEGWDNPTSTDAWRFLITKYPGATIPQISDLLLPLAKLVCQAPDNPINPQVQFHWRGMNISASTYPVNVILYLQAFGHWTPENFITLDLCNQFSTFESDGGLDSLEDSVL
jgi:hypothetical protein